MADHITYPYTSTALTTKTASFNWGEAVYPRPAELPERAPMDRLVGAFEDLSYAVCYLERLLRG